MRDFRIWIANKLFDLFPYPLNKRLSHLVLAGMCKCSRCGMFECGVVVVNCKHLLGGRKLDFWDVERRLRVEVFEDKTAQNRKVKE